MDRIDAGWTRELTAERSGTLVTMPACPTRTPEVHELGEFPMTCYNCHLYADS